jgi:membrane-associated protease RseP (regulator of RpoE activity)
MRLLRGLLVTAGLAAAPISAVAGPDTRSDDPKTETYEWLMTTSRPRLGVIAVSLTPELRKHFGAPDTKGVMIGHVEPGSAAAAAGLAVGDILTDIKGTGVESARDALAALASSKKDDAVRLSVIRDHQLINLSAKLLDDPAPAPAFDKDRRWPPWVDEWFKSIQMDPPWAHRRSPGKTT